MTIKNPEVDWVPFTNLEDHIAYCARICYASTNIKNNIKFVKNLWHNKHRSMYRHAPAYYKIPMKFDLPKTAYTDCHIHLYNGVYYVSTNMQTALEYFGKYERFKIPVCEAKIDKIFIHEKMLRYTFCIETGIDITRELNRKSPNNISEQSTRYVDFYKKIGICFKKCHWMNNTNIYKSILYKTMCKISEWFYKISRSKYGLNLPPEDARWILPLDVMSKVAYTYTVKDWERIINMRLYDWTGKAHPDAKIVAEKIKTILEDLGYNIINYKEEHGYKSSLV